MKIQVHRFINGVAVTEDKLPDFTIRNGAVLATITQAVQRNNQSGKRC
jgi:hypothetical protein